MSANNEYMEDSGDSFYGGRTGIPFRIAKKYTSVSDLKDAFEKTDNISEINYGEYALVTPELYSNPDNGKLYMRPFVTTKAQLETCEYGYIGQFCGPEGKGAAIQALMTVDNIKVANECADYPTAGKTNPIPPEYIDLGNSQTTPSKLIPLSTANPNKNNRGWQLYSIAEETFIYYDYQKNKWELTGINDPTHIVTMNEKSSTTTKTLYLNGFSFNTEKINSIWN